MWNPTGTRMSLAWPAIAAAAFVSAVVANREPALISARPPEIRTRLSNPPTPPPLTSVHSHLWEDPLWAEQQVTSAHVVHEERTKAQENVEAIMEKLIASLQAGGNVHLLPVLLPGAPFASAKEERVRVRYAVVSALHALEFKLSYPNRMTFVPVHVDQTVVKGFKKVEKGLRIPIKVFTKAADTRAGKSPLVQDQNLNAVIVLWINELQLGKRPMDVLGQILRSIFGTVVARRGDKMRLDVVGPYSSDTLAAIVRSDREDMQRNFFDLFEPGPNLYSARATVSIKDFGLSEDVTRTVLENGQLKCGLKLIPVIGTDRKLGRALSRELALRRAWPAMFEQRACSKRHVVLIYEQDSIYGRTFAKTILEHIPEENLHLFGYKQGLDGRNTKADGKRSEATIIDDTSYFDLPEGTSQLDYLRRIADEVSRRNELLNSSGRGRIVSVGVIGSDIFDKLLILRALRTRFPKARFFTTDLDARYWHRSEYPFTHNLIVASHFGLSLHRELKFDAAPFRGSYQTSAFYAVLTALKSTAIVEAFAGIQSENGLQPGQLVERSMDDPWRRRTSTPISALQPLIYEIGRSGPYRLALADEPESKTSRLLQAGRGLGRVRWEFVVLFLIALTALASILAFYFRGIQLLFEKIGAISSVLIPAFARNRLQAIFAPDESPKKVGDGESPVTPYWMIAFIAICALLLLIGGFDHQRPAGEPFVFFQGISTWPSVFIRLLTVLVGSWSIFHIWKKLVASKTLFEKSGDKTTKKNAMGVFSDYISGLDSGRRWVPILVRVVSCYVFGWILLYLVDMYPGTPSRGAIAYYVSVIITSLAVFGIVFVTYFVLYSFANCRECMNRMTKLVSKDGRDGSELDTIRIVAAHTELIGRFVYFPFLLVLGLAISRLAVFDEWDVTWPLILIVGAILVGLIVEVIRLRQAAGKLRMAMADGLNLNIQNSLDKNLDRKTVSRVVKADQNRLGLILDERGGAFRPLIEDPVFAAVAIPFGGTGSLILLERMVSVL